jgi:hypothetical protein
MATEAAKIYIKVETNASQANTQLSRLDQTTKKSTGTFKNFAKTFLGPLGITASIAGATVAVVKFTGAIIQAASDAEETANKFNVTFRDIRSDADEVGDNLARNFGLSRQAAQALLSATGDLLTGFGFSQQSALELSETANQLAVDLASFTNVPIQQAADAITKSLTGETEALKSLGIVVRQNTAEFRDSVAQRQAEQGITEAQARAQEILATAVAQSQNAIGDFARSSTSFANQQRIAQAAAQDLKATLGEALLPAATNLTGAFAVLVRGLDDFIRGTIDARKEAARVAGFNEENSRNFEAVADQLLRVFDIVNLDAETLSRRVGEIAEDFGATVGEVLNVATNLADVDVEQRRILNALILENAQREDAARLTAEQNALAEQAAESAERRAQERNAFLAEKARIAEEEAQREAEARERAAEEAAQAELEALRKTQEAALQGYEDLNQAAEDSRLVRAQVEEELANGIGETVEEFKATWRDYANSVTGLISAVSSIFDAQNAAEIEALRERGATDEEIAEKELEIAREQAKRKKATGIFNVGISTAEAIAEASPNPFLIGLAIATGAAQLAAIAATPLPTAQFGGSFMVPPGNEADSGLVRVNQGEQVDVTPVRQSGSSKPMQINLVLDGRVLARATVDAINSGNGGKIRERLVD